MSSPSAREAEAACLLSLEGALAAGESPDLVGYPDEVLEGALQALVKRHGAAAAPLLRAIADGARAKAGRKAAKRALYRLAQAGVDLATVAAILGHNSIRIVQRYVHPTAEHQRAAMARYDAALQATDRRERVQ